MAESFDHIRSREYFFPDFFRPHHNLLLLGQYFGHPPVFFL
jgi:hypothetical protein